MAQNITLLGANYSDVPGVLLPKTGGGSALFSDPSITTAVASDVASGKQFLLADGSIGTGTASGGGGTDSLVLLKTESLGYLNITSTSAISLEKSIVVNNLGGYDVLYIIVSADTIVTTPSQLAASVSYVWLTSSDYTTTITGTSRSSVIWNMKCQDNGGVRYSQRRTASTAYGIYVYSATFSSDDGSVTMPLYGKKNSTATGNIDGNYTARVYGLKIRDLIFG